MTVKWSSFCNWKIQNKTRYPLRMHYTWSLMEGFKWLNAQTSLNQFGFLGTYYELVPNNQCLQWHFKSPHHLSDRILLSSQADSCTSLSLCHSALRWCSCRRAYNPLRSAPPHTLGESRRTPQVTQNHFGLRDRNMGFTKQVTFKGEYQSI